MIQGVYFSPNAIATTQPTQIIVTVKMADVEEFRVSATSYRGQRIDVIGCLRARDQETANRVPHDTSELETWNE